MPVFERVEYFENALLSAINQSVKCKIIVLDNASTHNFIKETTLKYNIEYIRNESNIGGFPNWNKAFTVASTDFVFLLADDDILSPLYVESFLNALNQYPDIDIYYSDFILTNYYTGEKYPHSHILPFGYMENGIKIIEYGIRFKLGFPVITSAIKKSKFKGFYTDMHGSNDWLWIYSNAKELKFFGDNNVLLEYGRHEKQDTASSDTHMKCFISICYIYEEILANKINKAELTAIAKKLANNAFNYFIAIATPDFINELNIKNDIYAEYFRKKLKTNNYYKFIIKIPLLIRKTLYRIAIRFGLLEKI